MAYVTGIQVNVIKLEKYILYAIHIQTNYNVGLWYKEKLSLCPEVF